MKLTEYSELMAYDTAFWLQGLEDPDYPLDQLGDLCINLNHKFRILAVTLLLSEGITDAFCDNLHRSGLVRVKYLERLGQANKLDEHHSGSGRYSGIIDAIAAGSWAVARQIVKLSRREFFEGHEYPDDYAFAQLLHLLVIPDGDPDQVQVLLHMFEDYLDGESDARLDICDALHRKSQQDFDSAFADLLDQREIEIEAAIERGQILEADTLAERQIYVEGIALLRLAERQGLKIEQDYRFCPSIARCDKTVFPDERTWM